MFYTYVLKSDRTGKLYIGYTADIDARLMKHNSGGSKWTRTGIPWKIVYTKPFKTKTEAIKYEKFLKNLKSKKSLEKIIAG